MIRKINKTAAKPVKKTKPKTVKVIKTNVKPMQVPIKDTMLFQVSIYNTDENDNTKTCFNAPLAVGYKQAMYWVLAVINGIFERDILGNYADSHHPLDIDFERLFSHYMKPFAEADLDTRSARLMTELNVKARSFAIKSIMQEENISSAEDVDLDDYDSVYDLDDFNLYTGILPGSRLHYLREIQLDIDHSGEMIYYTININPMMVASVKADGYKKLGDIFSSDVIVKKTLNEVEFHPILVIPASIPSMSIDPKLKDSQIYTQLFSE